MESPLTLRHLDTPDDWARAFDVMRQLRPHLRDVDAFCAQLHEQHEQGYRLLAACDDDSTNDRTNDRTNDGIVGLAGYRPLTNLLYGRFVYVDDLVVAAHLQRSGVGARLLDGVRRIARDTHCAHFVLDTGLHMALAQRFYFRNGLLARGMHFVEPLAAAEERTR
jgi:GNAT superfamily N-acetyltransferase